MGERKRTARVLANWDPEGNVWIATSYDIPGLVLHAGTKEELVDKILEVARPLVEANMGDVPYELIAIDYIEQEVIDPVAA